MISPTLRGSPRKRPYLSGGDPGKEHSFPCPNHLPEGIDRNHFPLEDHEPPDQAVPVVWKYLLRMAVMFCLPTGFMEWTTGRVKGQMSCSAIHRQKL